MGTRLRHSRVAAGVVLAVALAAPPAIARADPPNIGGWVRPVPGPVVEPFDAPVSAYAPGHRGVDFGAAPGTPVVSANDGVVTFAGSVAGALHVVVLHDGGLRTSYSFLSRVDVRAGEHVEADQTVGATGGTGPAHDGDVLHFGLRAGDRYLDPMLLFRPVDLTEVIHLVPSDTPPAVPFGTTPAGEAVELALALDLPAIEVPEWARDLGVGVADDGGGLWSRATGAVGAATGWVAGQASGAWNAGAGVVSLLADQALGLAAVTASAQQTLFAGLRSTAEVAADLWAATPAGAAIRDLIEIGGRLREWRTAECSDDAPPADGTGGSGHLLMAVAGINSATGPEGASNALDVAALDYHPDEVNYFSYAADGGPYAAADTWGDLLTAGRRLGEQLRAIDAAQPGREVDLIAHSQGGIVVDVFLKYVYDAADPRYPPIGTIVTLASPHEGAPLATAATQIRSTRSGRAFLDVAAGVLPVPPAAATSPRQLAEDSAFLAALEARPLPDHLDYTTIGIATDVVVPATNVSLDGTTEAVVDVGALDAHSAALTDPNALRAIRAGLEGRPPPCVGVVDAVTGAVAPVLIRRAEHIAGDASEFAGRAADTVAP
jgi:hypothetical protein